MKAPGVRAGRKAMVAAIAAAVVFGTAVSAAAGGGEPEDTDDTKSGAQALCKRVPKIDKRIDRALKRLNGTADVRGSVARLERRAANAREAGHDEIETFLNNRLSFRKSLIPTLEQRHKDLDKVKDWCEANGYKATK